MKRQLISTTTFLFPQETKSLELLVMHFDTILDIVESGGSVSEISNALECRYSHAAKLYAAAATLVERFN